MRILLDENMDRRLQRLFGPEQDVTTVSENGWSGKKNGALLASAAELFDVFITMDRNIQFQQNLSSYDLKIILITAHSNRRADVEPAIPKILQILKKLKPGQVRIIEA